MNEQESIRETLRKNVPEKGKGGGRDPLFLYTTMRGTNRQKGEGGSVKGTRR